MNFNPPNTFLKMLDWYIKLSRPQLESGKIMLAFTESETVDNLIQTSMIPQD